MDLFFSKVRKVKRYGKLWRMRKPTFLRSCSPTLTELFFVIAAVVAPYRLLASCAMAKKAGVEGGYSCPNLTS